MKRGWAAAAGAMALALAVSGRGQELRHAALAEVVAVENGKTNLELEITAALEGGAVLEARGEGLEEALTALKSAGTERVEMSHVTAVVLGDGLDTEELLWQQVKHRKSGYGATVWLAAEGEAGALLSQAEEPAERLRNLEENGGAGAPGVMEALRALTEVGEVEVPIIDVEDGKLVLVGREIIRASEAGE